MTKITFKQKSEKIILDFLYKNKGKSFTVKQIGQLVFCKNLSYFHNVTEFLRSLNDQGLVTFTYKGMEMKRSECSCKLMGGTYQYNSGVGISTDTNIVDLWKKETIDFLLTKPRKAFITTQIAKFVCGCDLIFMNTQSFIMNQLEKEGVVIFFHEGRKSEKNGDSITGSWMLNKHYYNLSR